MAHFFLALFLLFQQLALAGDVASVALGGYVFAQGGDGFAGDDFGAYGCLYGNFVLLAGQQFFQFFADFAAKGFGLAAVYQGRERIHRLAVEEDVQFDQVGAAVVYGGIVEGGIAPRDGFEAVVKVEDDLGQRQLEAQLYAIGGEVELVEQCSALF